jgi:hypothetical protein
MRHTVVGTYPVRNPLRGFLGLKTPRFTHLLFLSPFGEFFNVCVKFMPSTPPTRDMHQGGA